MLQAITDKCADYAFPILIGTGAWFVVHYAVFAERIMMKELPETYQTYDFGVGVPQSAKHCVLNNIIKETLERGRLEAALYTASFRHIKRPFLTSQIEVEKMLAQQCGVSQARAEALARQQQEAELEFLRKKQQLKEVAIARAQELKSKAEQAAREQTLKMGMGILGLILGASE